MENSHSGSDNFFFLCWSQFLPQGFYGALANYFADSFRRPPERLAVFLFSFFLSPGYKKLFNSSPNIPSIIYSARANPGTPKVRIKTSLQTLVQDSSGGAGKACRRLKAPGRLPALLAPDIDIELGGRRLARCPVDAKSRRRRKHALLATPSRRASATPCCIHNPQVSPKAGNMNAAIFSNTPGEEPVIGAGARIVVVNDARHRLKTEFLQRTVPYFFKLDRRTGKKYEWADVGFVQTPQRFEDLKDGDPLGNHAVLT